MRTVVLALLLALVLTTACAPTAPPVPTAPTDDAACESAPPGFTHGFTAVAGARLHWVRGGPAGAADPVVLVPGFPETWATWRPVMTRLARDRPVVAVDTRGTGCSSVEPDGYDTTTLAADLAALLPRLGAARVTVVGHDLGGMVAWAWARTRPDQVGRLVVLGAGIPGLGLEESAPPHVAAFGADPDGVAHTLAADPRTFLRRFVADRAFEDTGALDASVRAYAPPERATAALRRYQALPRSAAANQAAGPLPASVAVLALDGGAPGITATSLRRAATTVDTAVVRGAGHYAPVDRPDAVADTITAFAR